MARLVDKDNRSLTSRNNGKLGGRPSEKPKKPADDEKPDVFMYHLSEWFDSIRALLSITELLVEDNYPYIIKTKEIESKTTDKKKVTMYSVWTMGKYLKKDLEYETEKQRFYYARKKAKQEEEDNGSSM